MSIIVDKLRVLRSDAEGIAADLPTEDMFLRFSEDIVNCIEGYIDEVKEALG